jgi:cytochrome c oxidase subunit 4
MSHDHAHHVSSFRLLFAILVILLIMTALTVYTAKFVDLGEMGNLILAMFIACFKAILVCAVFMHLLHDKFLNTVALVVCMLLVATFIGITMIDMSSRGALDPTRESFIGPPPMSEANINAAIEKRDAEHGDHGEHGDHAADDAGHTPADGEHGEDEHAEDEHADEDGH